MVGVPGILWIRECLYALLGCGSGILQMCLPPQLGSQKGNVYFLKRKPMCLSPKWIAFLFSWGTERWLMDRYPLHQQFIPAHGKLMPVKLGGRFIDLLTGTREINAGQIRGPVQWFIKPAHGKLMQVKLGCLRIDLLTGFRHWVRFILYFLESTFHL